jgi:hypothetical protein
MKAVVGKLSNHYEHNSLRQYKQEAYKALHARRFAQDDKLVAARNTSLLTGAVSCLAGAAAVVSGVATAPVFMTSLAFGVAGLAGTGLCQIMRARLESATYKASIEVSLAQSPLAVEHAAGIVLKPSINPGLSIDPSMRPSLRRGMRPS